MNLLKRYPKYAKKTQQKNWLAQLKNGQKRHEQRRHTDTDDKWVYAHYSLTVGRQTPEHPWDNTEEMLRLAQPRTAASAGEVSNGSTQPLPVNSASLEDIWVVSLKKHN